jgi:hypothetical protein
MQTMMPKVPALDEVQLQCLCEDPIKRPTLKKVLATLKMVQLKLKSP